MPRCAAAGSSGSGGSPRFGVPLVPEDRKPYVGCIGVGVVDMQPATVAQLETSLVHYGPTIISYGEYDSSS